MFIVIYKSLYMALGLACAERKLDMGRFEHESQFTAVHAMLVVSELGVARRAV